MFNLLFVSFLGVIITLPFGFLFLKNHEKTISSYSKILFYGIIIISFISVFLNFFTPLSKIICTLIILISFFIIFRNKNFFFNLIFIKFSIIASLIVFILVFNSTVYRPDAYLYHLPFINILNEFKIIIGLTNLHFRFGHTSILQYTSAIYNNFIFFEKGILLPSALIGSSIILNFSSQLGNYIKKKNFNIHFFYLLFITIFIAYKMNRYSEYGNDYPAHFIFYYIISEIILSFKSKNKDFSNLFLVSAFILMNKLSMIFSIILPFLILNKIEKKKILNYKNLFSLIFLLIWIIKNSLISGCLLYPISKTCLLDLPWTNIHKTNKVSIETEAWSKSWNNEKNPKFLNQEIYIKNFNWINTWSENHLNKINKILIPYLIFLILITIYIDTKSKKTKKKIKYKKELKLILILIILIAVWFIKIPLFRFGFSYLVCLISLFFAIVCSKYENYKNKKIFLSLFAFCIIVFIGKNLLRFENYFTEYNQNIWPKIKIQNENKLKKVDIGELKYYESQAECGYGFAPCTNYKNLKLTFKKFRSYKVIIDNEKTN